MSKALEQLRKDLRKTNVTIAKIEDEARINTNKAFVGELYI